RITCRSRRCWRVSSLSSLRKQGPITTVVHYRSTLKLQRVTTINNGGYWSRLALRLAWTTASCTQLAARHQKAAGDRAGAGGEFVARAARGGGVAFQHALEQAARNADDG